MTHVTSLNAVVALPWHVLRGPFGEPAERGTGRGGACLLRARPSRCSYERWI